MSLAQGKQLTLRHCTRISRKKKPGTIVKGALRNGLRGSCLRPDSLANQQAFLRTLVANGLARVSVIEGKPGGRDKLKQGYEPRVRLVIPREVRLNPGKYFGFDRPAQEKKHFDFTPKEREEETETGKRYKIANKPRTRAKRPPTEAELRSAREFLEKDTHIMAALDQILGSRFHFRLPSARVHIENKRHLRDLREIEGRGFLVVRQVDRFGSDPKKRNLFTIQLTMPGVKHGWTRELKASCAFRENREIRQAFNGLLRPKENSLQTKVNVNYRQRHALLMLERAGMLIVRPHNLTEHDGKTMWTIQTTREGRAKLNEWVAEVQREVSGGTKGKNVLTRKGRRKELRKKGASLVSRISDE